MNKIFFRKTIGILLFLFLFAPLVSLAALENVYPATLGTEGTTITANSSLGETVKYFASWAIIIGAIIVFGSLIAAGLQYLSSTGDPAKMKDASKRILNAFLGLLILLGSYLVLYTVNPQLTILEVKKTYQATASVSANPTTNPPTAAPTNIKQATGGPFKFITNGAKKLWNFGNGVFKQVKGGSILEVNFDGFELNSFSILADENGKVPPIKLLLYPFADFQTSKTINGKKYTWPVKEVLAEPSGTVFKNIFFRMRLDGEKILGLNGEEITVGPGDHHDFSLKPDIDDPKVNPSPEYPDNKYILTPPLSVRVIGTGPGIYLYEKQGGALYNEVYLYSSNEDFRARTIDDDIDFNDKATEIEIKNEATDYLAILYENPGFEGQFRIFLEDKERKVLNPAKADYIKASAGNVKSEGDIKVAVLKNESGSTVLDQFGKVDKPSSLFLTKLSDDPSVCQEVRICNGPEFAGDCIVYLPPGKDIVWDDENQNVGLAKMIMPLYLPENIPDSISSVSFKDENGGIKTRDAEFGDNIYSLKIKGNCLVGLLDHKTKQEFPWWESSGPGSNSEMFNQSEFDLNPNQITSCKPIKGIGFWTEHSCASAIMIFPTNYTGGASGSF